MNIHILKTRVNEQTDCCGGHNLLPIDMAISKGLALAEPLTGFETVNLFSARGRSITDNVYARLPLPNFNNSAMDGYAINNAGLIGTAPYRLEITGRMAAGDQDIDDITQIPSGALRILTGAVVPANYNAVIMQEKVQVEDNHITIDKAPTTGDNIRPCGEDCQAGDLIIAAGTLLEAQHIAILAAQGISEITVRRKIRVAIFSTGSELRLPGEELQSGQIYNSNRYALACQLDQPFIEVIDLGTIRDDYQILKDAMATGAEMADMVITTGGVSVGDEDHMPGIVTDLGGELHVMKVAIKPGKPVTVGTIGKCIFLGLPGNPVAAFVNQILIGRAIIAKLSGQQATPPASYSAIAQFDCRRSSSRQEYVPARIVGKDQQGNQIVQAFSKAGSATLLPLANSDGFVVLPIGMAQVNSGDVVEFIPH